MNSSSTRSPLAEQDVLNAVSNDWSTRQMRRLASSLLRLADAIEQDWQPPAGQPVFRWPNKLNRIERDSYLLGEKARLIYDQRKQRTKFVPVSLLAEPAWDMLLELFQQYAGKARVSTNSLCIASGSPATTALRYINELEKCGLIERSEAVHDKRVTFVELTKKGVLAVGSYLAEV